MFSKIIKIVTLLIFLAFAGIQFWRPDFNNPPVKPGERIEDVYDVPDDVTEILKRSCADCHSHETVYPWYSRIAPLSWGMHDHIREGREELNFSKWATYSEKRRERKLEEMCEEVREGQMPFYQYLWLHPESRLSTDQTDTLCEWTESAENSQKEGGRSGV